jgi:hypothetical protein
VSQKKKKLSLWKNLKKRDRIHLNHRTFAMKAEQSVPLLALLPSFPRRRIS